MKILHFISHRTGTPEVLAIQAAEYDENADAWTFRYKIASAAERLPEERRIQVADY